MKKVLVIIIALVIIGALSFLGFRLYAKPGLNQGTRYGQENRRQAVFLTNGQVYFGNILNADRQLVELRNIYYFKTPETADGTDPNKANENKNQLSLVKLGSELHGPEDVMYINRDQLLFFEDMRPDSKVNDAIKKLESEKK
ncbi:MAG: hypothetical protein AAB360_02405 [Patescibacteria group bacterium]